MFSDCKSRFLRLFIYFLYSSIFLSFLDGCSDIEKKIRNAGISDTRKKRRKR